MGQPIIPIELVGAAAGSLATEVMDKGAVAAGAASMGMEVMALFGVALAAAAVASMEAQQEQRLLEGAQETVGMVSTVAGPQEQAVPAVEQELEEHQEQGVLVLPAAVELLEITME